MLTLQAFRERLLTPNMPREAKNSLRRSKHCSFYISESKCLLSFTRKGFSWKFVKLKILISRLRPLYWYRSMLNEKFKFHSWCYTHSCTVSQVDFYFDENVSRNYIIFLNTTLCWKHVAQGTYGVGSIFHTVRNHTQTSLMFTCAILFSFVALPTVFPFLPGNFFRWFVSLCSMDGVKPDVPARRFLPRTTHC